MGKVQRADSGRMPPRSENFQRMLELEKQYKMQRIQDNPSSTASLPSTASAPTQPSSAARSRRGSGYPPLSHQDQIMKAMNRGSTLPSLSISIPPSPPQDSPPKTSDSREEPQPAKEERTKNVTFSDPEEDDSSLSDQSSICHSPSWEGWGKKTKKPNKPGSKEERNKEEKPGKTLRKKGNRLSKAPPQEPLTNSTARSQSTLQLEPLPKIDRGTGNAPRLDKQETMAQPQVDQKQSSSQGDNKPKSRRFLSGFKRQHGSVPDVKKPMENTPRQTELKQPGHERSISTPSISKPPSASTGFDLGFLRSRRSSADPTVRSQSSTEKRPPLVRPPSSSSSHTRSQSLLSSTLEKLRGPSYLYHRPQDGKNSKSGFRPASRDEEGLQPPVSPMTRPGSSEATTPIMDNSTFTRKSRHKLTTSNNGVSLDPPPVASQPLGPPDLNRGYDLPEPPRFPGLHNHKSSPRVSDGESTIRDSQEDIQWVSESQGTLQGQGHPTGRILDSRNRKAQAEKTEPERRHKTNGQVNNQVSPPAEILDDGDQESVASSQDDDYASANEHQSDHASTRALRRGDVSRAAVGHSVPTIRPSSREKDVDRSRTPRRSEPSLLPPPNNIGQALTSDPNADPKTAKSDESSKMEKLGSDIERSQGTPRTPLQQLRPKHSADYFTFINESYAPPSLELRSPLENLLQSLNQSKRLEKVEISDEPRTRSSSRPPVSEIPIYVETPTAMYKEKTDVKSGNGHMQRGSPAMHTQVSEREVPSYERLGTSARATKAHSGSDAGSTSTRQSQQHEASHSTSGRSSSSTFGDSPPSPSSMTTPESSRPHSHKSRPPSHLDLNKSALVLPSSGSEDKSKQRVFPLSSRDRSSSRSRSRPTSREINAQDDNWSRSALPLDLENYSAISLSGGADVLASSPALVSTPTSMTFADALKEEIAEDLSYKNNSRDALQPKAHSALDLPSTSFLPALKHRPLNPKKNSSKLAVTVVSAPNSPLSEPIEEPLKPALKKSRNNIGSSSSQEPQPQVLVSSGAAYLQEARKTVSGAPIPAPRTLRPHIAHRNTTIGAKGAAAPGRAEPMAKMLVECCSCHFFHDMPARVYECMAKPDSFVEDKTLGVSAAITTMVKCPWCGHGMTTQCCAGYAAVVYLKEKLHGR